MTIDFSPDVDDPYLIRVYGEISDDLPQDLYIPPEAFAVLLEQFEGPLDFLLYLVQKNGFDLTNIDIAPIAQQYLAYMEKMKSLDIELTADYMLMAALLASLKSRLLLPQTQSELNIEKDPKKQLIDRLEQYLRIKQAAKRLGEINILERDVFDAKADLGERGKVFEGYNAQLLHDAMFCLLHAPSPHQHVVEHEPVLLEERIAFISEKLSTGAILPFYSLLNPKQGRLGTVVTFVAVLELVKQQHIVIIQDGSSSPLSVQGKYYVTSSIS